MLIILHINYQKQSIYIMVQQLFFYSSSVILNSFQFSTICIYSIYSENNIERFFFPVYYIYAVFPAWSILLVFRDLYLFVINMLFLALENLFGS